MTDDRALVDRARQGDTDAFRQLVDRSKTMVYRLAYDLTGNRLDAEDLSQDVFVKAYRSLANFRGEAQWSTWIYRITINTCYDHGRSSMKRTMEYRDDIEADATMHATSHHHPAPRPDRSTESSMIQQNIAHALEQLTPQERTVFVLRHYHDLPLKQIATTMAIAEGTVKSYLFRAVHRLQQELSFYRKDLGLEQR